MMTVRPTSTSRPGLRALVVAFGTLALCAGLVAQDFPGLKGGSAKTGRATGTDAAVAASGPGRAQLAWFYPNGTVNAGATVVRNNTATAAGVITRAGTWAKPRRVEEANFPYNAPDTGSALGNALVGSAYDPDNPVVAARASAYEYARTTLSAVGNDPSVPLTPADHATFAFNLDPQSPVQRNYAAYVHIPAGPTTVPADNPWAAAFAGRRFMARYLVVEVQYGNGQRYVERIDTYVSGQGWVRIGANGAPTTRLFEYNGTNPIVVRVHNTIPRSTLGVPLDNAAPGSQLVYADAALLAPDAGAYVGGVTVQRFDVGGPVATRAVAARNDTAAGLRNGQPVTVARGTVTSYDHQTGQVRWTFSPVEVGNETTTQDNTSAGVANNGFTGSTSNPNYRGTNYFTASQAGWPVNVTYSPNLEEGAYEVQMYLAGDVAGENYMRRARVRVEEGALQEWVEVDMSRGPGWYTIGNRRFVHRESDPLRVVVTNRSNDPGADVGRVAYADAVRFIGAVNLAINSTPLQTVARVRTTSGIQETPVVIVAAEDGRIYCLDGIGNANGTTTVYWTYPSIREGALDPNLNQSVPGGGAGIDGRDGQLIAEMPDGFDRTSPLVERIDGEDFLFIASRNGRVYKIEMAGRGDYDVTAGTPGTTRRAWSFPGDYPGNRVPSNLGRFTGSVAFGTLSGDRPTLFVPAPQGRMYALDARGSTASPGVPTSGRTSIRWAFPQVTQPVVGEIAMTPAVDFNRVFFGTRRLDDRPGQFFALDWETGLPVWTFERDGTVVNQPATDDFLGGPATASAALLGAPQDLVFVTNENNTVYALEASTATPAVAWSTNELRVGSQAPLSVGPMITRDNITGNFEVLTRPVVMVGTRDGRAAALYARPADLNSIGTRLARQWSTGGEILGNVAIGRNFMYFASTNGRLQAYNDAGGSFGPGDNPPDEDVTPNDPRGALFRQARIRVISRDGYQALRRAAGDPALPNYGQATGGFPLDPPRNPLAFDWGETIYFLVYDFPYAVLDTSGDPVPPPVVNFTFATEGSTVRQIPVEARQILVGAPANRDGYAVLAFTIQGGGGNGLAPGNGNVSISISSQSLNDNNSALNVTAPNATANFIVANPLAVAMRTTGTGAPDALRSMGYSNNPSDPQNIVNGSPNVDGPAGNSENLLGTSFGSVEHGKSGSTLIQVADRSLLTLIRGPGRGLDQVRLTRRDLAWQGAASTVLRPIDALLYPDMEDLPTRFPNDSLDYPDIKREFVSAVKDPNGESENPLFNGVSLRAPVGPGASLDPDVNPVTEDNFSQRRILSTPFQFTVNVPRFQPANINFTQADSGGSALAAGYSGRFNVFVDTAQTGTIDGAGRREAYRGFFLTTSVAPDVRLSVQTPTVDLGSLAGGTGYTLPGAADPLNPWASSWNPVFRPFEVLNEGNINLLDLRVAKGTTSAGNYRPWAIFAPANDNNAWLDASVNLWTDFDTRFGPQPRIVLQKSRVGDESATSLSVNPIRRDNATLGVGAGPVLNPAQYPVGPPRVGVSIPIGFPVGTYSQVMRVIEDFSSVGQEGQALGLDGAGRALEAFSDPTFSLRFNVRETRLTNSFTRFTAPMVDDLVPAGAPPAFTWQNLQPAGFRDGTGNLYVAWASNRPEFVPNPTQPSGPDVQSWRLFFGSVTGTSPAAAPAAAGQNPLRDLTAFTPAGPQRWFNQNRGPFPFGATDASAAQANALFGAAGTASDRILGTSPGDEDSVRFGSPAFPAAGLANPFNPATPLTAITFGFVGEAQRQTAGGRFGVSQIFLSSVTRDGGGNVTISDPISMGFDPEMPKSRPALVQTDAGTTVFFTGVASGQTQMYWSFFNGTSFTAPSSVSLGTGFEQVGAPSVSARPYQGADGSLLAGRTRMLELTFAGKLRGRTVTEIFYGRLPSDSSGRPANAALLPPRPFEALVADTEPGVFRALGVNWNRPFSYVLLQRFNGQDFDLLVPGTREDNRTTGIVTFDTTLGGKVYLDPNLGTVRFANASPPAGAVVFLSYQPRLLRVSGATVSGYDAPAIRWDNRLISDASFWANPSNQAIGLGDQIAGDPARSNRLVFTYGRAAAGGGQTARPFMTTLRLGVQLPLAVHTQPDGTITSMQVTGAQGFYQVDPATGRLYFSPLDEDRVVNVRYVGVDPGTGQPVPIRVTTYRVGLVIERPEAPIPIEQATNESGVWPFLDPFEDTAFGRRPGLIWLFYSSTRNGSPDVYFQTLAPRFTPVVSGN